MDNYPNITTSNLFLTCFNLTAIQLMKLSWGYNYEQNCGGAGGVAGNW